jgi:hypothetical protein
MLIVALACTPILTGRVDDSKLTLVPNQTVGTTRKVKFTVSAEIQDHETVVNGIAVTNYSKVGPDRTEYSVDWEDMNADEGGQPTKVPFKPYQVAVGPKAQLLSLTGGIGEEAADPVATFLVSYFPLPGQELVRGRSVTFTLPPNDKMHIPGMNVSETFIGAQNTAGVDSFQIKVTLASTDSGFKVDADYWVDKSGNVVKETGKFVKLPLPIGGLAVDGTITSNLAP